MLKYLYMKRLFWMIVFLIVLIGIITVIGAFMAFVGLQQFESTPLEEGGEVEMEVLEEEQGDEGDIIPALEPADEIIE